MNRNSLFMQENNISFALLNQKDMKILDEKTMKEKTVNKKLKEQLKQVEAKRRELLNKIEKFENNYSQNLLKEKKISCFYNVQLKKKNIQKINFFFNEILKENLKKINNPIIPIFFEDVQLENEEFILKKKNIEEYSVKVFREKISYLLKINKDYILLKDKFGNLLSENINVFKFAFPFKEFQVENEQEKIFVSLSLDFNEKKIQTEDFIIKNLIKEENEKIKKENEENFLKIKNENKKNSNSNSIDTNIIKKTKKIFKIWHKLFAFLFYLVFVFLLYLNIFLVLKIEKRHFYNLSVNNFVENIKKKTLANNYIEDRDFFEIILLPDNYNFINYTILEKSLLKINSSQNNFSFIFDNLNYEKGFKELTNLPLIDDYTTSVDLYVNFKEKVSESYFYLHLNFNLENSLGYHSFTVENDYLMFNKNPAILILHFCLIFLSFLKLIFHLISKIKLIKNIVNENKLNKQNPKKKKKILIIGKIINITKTFVLLLTIFSFVTKILCFYTTKKNLQNSGEFLDIKSMTKFQQFFFFSDFFISGYYSFYFFMSFLTILKLEKMKKIILFFFDIIKIGFIFYYQFSFFAVIIFYFYFRNDNELFISFYELLVNINCFLAYNFLFEDYKINSIFFFLFFGTISFLVIYLFIFPIIFILAQKNYLKHWQ